MKMNPEEFIAEAREEIDLALSDWSDAYTLKFEIEDDEMFADLTVCFVGGPEYSIRIEAWDDKPDYARESLCIAYGEESKDGLDQGSIWRHLFFEADSVARELKRRVG